MGSWKIPRTWGGSFEVVSKRPRLIDMSQSKAHNLARKWSFSWILAITHHPRGPYSFMLLCRCISMCMHNNESTVLVFATTVMDKKSVTDGTYGINVPVEMQIFIATHQHSPARFLGTWACIKKIKTIFGGITCQIAWAWRTGQKFGDAQPSLT